MAHRRKDVRSAYVEDRQRQLKRKWHPRASAVCEEMLPSTRETQKQTHLWLSLRAAVQRHSAAPRPCASFFFPHVVVVAVVRLLKNGECASVSQLHAKRFAKKKTYRKSDAPRQPSTVTAVRTTRLHTIPSKMNFDSKRRRRACKREKATHLRMMSRN